MNTYTTRITAILFFLILGFYLPHKSVAAASDAADVAITTSAAVLLHDRSPGLAVTVANRGAAAIVLLIARISCESRLRDQGDIAAFAEIGKAIPPISSTSGYGIEERGWVLEPGSEGSFIMRLPYLADPPTCRAHIAGTSTAFSQLQ